MVRTWNWGKEIILFLQLASEFCCWSADEIISNTSRVFLDETITKSQNFLRTRRLICSERIRVDKKDNI
jgi:hypothetical protein